MGFSTGLVQVRYIKQNPLPSSLHFCSHDEHLISLVNDHHLVAPGSLSLYSSHS